ncbi:unnamed protein product [Stenotrophomonas maltophilia]|nr:unnamed protein product [Stenotrophomonas maltophilia]
MAVETTEGRESGRRHGNGIRGDVRILPGQFMTVNIARVLINQKSVPTQIGTPRNGWHLPDSPGHSRL